MNCPICNSATGIEVNTHSGGYAKGLMECADCGAMWLCEDTEITVLDQKAA